MQPRRWSGRPVQACLLAVSTLALGLFFAPIFQAGVPTEETLAARGFIENRGQIDPAVRYYAAGNQSAVFFTPEGPVLEIRVNSPAGEKAEPLPTQPTRSREQRTRSRASRVAMAIRFVDAGSSIAVSGLEPLSARSHFLNGNDSEAWHTDVRSIAR